MKSVDQQVREFYSRQALPEARAREMLAHAKERRRVRRSRLLGGVAAALLVALVAAWGSALFTASRLADRAAAEVAMNHRKDLGVEVVAGDYAELGTLLDKLPFALERPESRALRGYRLVGGRYCSIQAQLAAQLKVFDPESGEHATLYVTRLTESLGPLEGVSREVEGVSIDMWRQGGLLFALAETSP
ncbi:MAG: hypothetical protein AAF725_24415 [Acidobacteriota bacterium]